MADPRIRHDEPPSVAEVPGADAAGSRSDDEETTDLDAEIDDDYGDEWACTWCDGEGFDEVDDPMLDDCDEFGWGKCSACNGTGLRKHQTIF